MTRSKRTPAFAGRTKRHAPPKAAGTQAPPSLFSPEQWKEDAMANAPQQTAPEKKTPLGNKIALCIMLGLGLIAGVLQLTHGNGGRQQEAASSHHSLHSATTGSGG
jgi:hypothetical protein